MDFKKILRKLDEFKIITMPAIFIVFTLFVVVLIYYFISAYPAIERYGIDLFITNVWKAAEDTSKEVYGLAAPIWGSIYTSIIAVILAIPISIGYAIYVNDYAPEKLKYPLIIISDVMAGLPSVIYGIWGAFVLVPFLRDNIMKFLYENFSYIPFFSTPPMSGYSYLSAGVLLAIMVIPFASAIIREAYAMVPKIHKEGLYALGATRYEATKVIVNYIKPAILSGFILAFGRALGETVAVSLVIGNSFNITFSLFSPGYTISSLIANQFGNAVLYKYMVPTMYAGGLVLFVVGLIVNLIGIYYLRRWRSNVSH